MDTPPTVVIINAGLVPISEIDRHQFNLQWTGRMWSRISIKICSNFSVWLYSIYQSPTFWNFI